MTNDLIDDDAKTEVLGRFLEELETSADAASLVRQYSAEHPQWSADFAEEAALSRLLVTSRDGFGLPNLERLPDFQIVRWVATGGMGIVYEAQQLSLNRRVALKVRYGRASTERQARFQREQFALARLHQSHIVPIHVSGEVDGWQFFAMAFIEGASLHHLIKAALDHLRDSSAPLPALPALVERHLAQSADVTHASAVTQWSASAVDIPRAREKTSGDPAESKRPLTLSMAYLRSVATLMADAANALEFAHGAGVVHRDIKPSNVMVDRPGHCWLIDFGLAQYAGTVEAPSSAPGFDPAGQTMGPMGTPEYMAPEQHQPSPAGSAADPRSDVWGLGTTLYELLTLSRPFAGHTYQEIKQKVLEDEPIPIEALVRNAPADLAAICRKAMHKNVHGRYACAGDLAADLRRWLNGEPTTARPVRLIRGVWMWACRNRGWAVGLTSLLFLLAAIAVSIMVFLQAETQQAELRASAAEEQQRIEYRNSQLQRRESLMQQVQQLQLGRANNGWSQEAWTLVREAAQIQRDERLRDLAAATLLGLDATLVKRFPRPASSVAFAADGKRLLFGGSNGSASKNALPARLWLSDSDQERPSTLPGEGPVGFDADGTPLQLVFQDRQEKIVLWNVLEGKPVREFRLPKATPAADATESVLVMSASIAHVAASVGKQTLVWNVAFDSVVASFAHHADAVAFSDGSDRMALAESGQQRVIVWSLKGKKVLAELPTSNVATTSLAFGRTARLSQDGSGQPANEYLAVGDAGGTVTIWDWQARQPIAFCRGSPREIVTLAFSPDGTLLASAGRLECRLWNVAGGQLLLRLRDPQGMDYVTGLAFSPDGRQLAVSSKGVFAAPSVTVWDLTAGRGLHRFSGLSAQIEAIAISADGRHLAALAHNLDVGLWDLGSGQLRAIFAAPPGAYTDNAGLAFSPDGSRLAFSVSGALAGEVRLWNVESHAEMRRWKLPPGLQNKLVFDQTNRLWQFQTEVANGMGLPDSNLDWREHPRVGRIRELTAADPRRVVAEVVDFNRHIYLVVAATDGRHLVMEGLGGRDGDQRSVKIIELATGKSTWSHGIHRDTMAAQLILEPSGDVFYFMPTESLPVIGIKIPDGQPGAQLDFRAHAAAGGAEYHGIMTPGAKPSCSVHYHRGTKPVVNLTSDADLVAIAFDHAARRLVWGGTDGTIVVGDLPEIRKRLNQLDLGW